MPSPSSPLSIDICCEIFPACTLSLNVAKWLVDYFLAATGHSIAAVQEFPGKVPLVSFVAGGEIHRAQFLNEGEITINGVKCMVIRSLPPPPTYTNVVVFQFPFEGDNNLRIECLRRC